MKNSVLLFITVLGLLTGTGSHAQGFDMKAELKRLSPLDTFPANLGFNNLQAVSYLKRELSYAIDLYDQYRLIYMLSWQYINAGYPDSALIWMDQIPDDEWERAYKMDASYDRTMMTALCHLRAGEQKNCQENHNNYSCFLPLRPEALHEDKTGSQKAIEYYSIALKRDPNNYTAKWLMNIAYMTLGKYPDEVPKEHFIDFAKFPQDTSLPYFENVADKLGVNTLTFYGASVVEDFNNDGFLDIFATSGALYHNVELYLSDKKGGYINATDKANLRGITGGGNATHADYNNDGFVDIYITRGGWLGPVAGKLHPNSLLQNNGDGTFTDVTYKVGMLAYFPSHTASWADFDNDGWLDIFVGNESGYSQFLRNNKGIFENVGEEYGINVNEFVKGSFAADYNKDGWMDLYVSNINKENMLFRNNGPGTNGKISFTNVAAFAGVTKPITSFGTFFFDFNNDGFLDLFCAAYPANVSKLAEQFVKDTANVEFSSLYKNNGDGTFTDVTAEFNLNRSIEAMGLNFGDIDSDGFLDFYVGTGYPSLEALMPNLMFRNDNGQQFLQVSNAGFGHLQKGHGISFGDLDNDGDEDIYASLGGFIHSDQFWNILLENPGVGNNWVTLDLEGITSNKSAIGAEITIEASDSSTSRKIFRVVGPGGSYGSSSLQQEIGLGKCTEIKSIEIYWPTSKTKQVFENVAINKTYRITEDAVALKEVATKKIKLGGESAPHNHNDHHHH